MIIRTVTKDDASAILDIYSYYILNTAITFEWTVPSISEFKERISEISSNYPYLVAEDDEYNIIGYAYLSRYNKREAFSWCAELSIYIDKNNRSKGLGRILYKALEEEARKRSLLKILSCIAYSENDSVYLPSASIPFHESIGFEKCGFVENAGFKFSKWWDIVWMEKNIGNYSQKPMPYLKQI